MRKIEIKMVEAIRRFKPVSLGNTTVTCRVREDGISVVSVYLHGNLVAQRGSTGWGICMCGWNTQTTRSRINAVLATFSRGRVFSKSGGAYFSAGGVEREIDTRSWLHVDI